MNYYDLNLLLPGNCGFLRGPMTSHDLLGIGNYCKLNPSKLPVNSRTAKPRKNRKHRTANRKPQTENNFVAPGACATLLRRVNRLKSESLGIHRRS